MNDLLEPGARYVALGSSFAAGPGISPRVKGSPPLAMRSQRNYAHQLAADFGLDLHDATYSGATALDICQGSARQPRQIDALDAHTRLVTVTCGGNDVGYVSGLSLGMLPGWLRGSPGVRRRRADVMAGADARFEVLPASLDRLYGEIRSRAPDATLVVVDYLTLLPPEGRSAAPMLPDVAGWGREVAARLAQETAAAVERAGAVLVAASAASASHHAWSADPWTTKKWIQWGSGFPFHPTDVGMAQVARLIADRLQGQ